MIKAENLVKKYGDVIALDGVSFEMNEGEVVGVLGPNGAGKTTLLRILVTFLDPTGGKVMIDRLDAGKTIHQREIKSKIGYLPEHAPLYEDMKVGEYLEFVGKMQGIDKDKLKERVSYVFQKCGLVGKENDEISTLSKGYRQRVGIAQALIHNPKIVILDEPTTGLDPNQRIEIRSLIQEIGKSKTVVLSSHVLSEVQSTCSRIIILNKGKIAADGSPDNLEKQMEKKATVNIEVENVSSALIEKLKALEGVTRIEKEGQRIDIITDGEKDIRKDVSEIAVGEKCGLLELTRKQTDLEDVFISLTKE